MKLRSLILSFAAVVAAIAVSAAAPKYIFYFIGDGMGPVQMMAADNYYRTVLGNDDHLAMMQLPVNSFATTYSASSPVTDSAAAGTALSTGHKTRNGMLGMDADTIAVNSVAAKLHDSGYGVAIITTVAADDATPGAFYAHVPSRKMYYEIGRQAAESGYELIGGASMRGTVDKTTKEPTDLMDYIASQGVDIVYGTEALANSTSRRALLLPDTPVWEWNCGYAVDSIAGAMNLLQMTDAAINHLRRHTPEAFFIMAEGGSIDHSGHANDGGSVIKETIAFNEAIARAIDFYNQHPDETLIIITADHETGGMSVGNARTKYNYHTRYFQPQRYSKERFSRLCDDLLVRPEGAPDWAEMQQILSDALGLFTFVPVNEADTERLHNAFSLTFEQGAGDREETLYADTNNFAVEVFNVLNNIAGIGWTTSAHSGCVVPLFAIGEGAELFMGNNDNTSIPEKILRAAGLQ